MKSPINFTAAVILILSLKGIVLSQSASNITYQAGTNLEIQSGADICATDIIINGTYSGTGTICAGVLPVTMLGFSAITSRNSVILKWETADEMNNSGFSIERKDGIAGAVWNIVSFIKGAGTSTVPLSYAFTDNKLAAGTYFYRLKQIDFNGNYEYFSLPGEVLIKAPGIFSVTQNYPNPSNPSSVIEFQIPEAGIVTMKIYDITGREVATVLNEYLSADFHSFKFDGSGYASGIYFYTLTSGKYYKTNKMILVK